MSSATENLTLERMVKSLKDPRANLYTLLVKARRPVSRKRLIELTGEESWTVDRALRFLYKAGLVDKIQGRQETFYFPVP